MDLKVAFIQFDIAWEDAAANMAYLNKKIESISDDTDLLLLPEMFHCGFSMSPQDNAQNNGGKVLEWMKGVALKHNLVVMGTVAVECKGGYYNRLYVVKSNEVIWYDKRHLFTMGNEHLHYQKGAKRIIVELGGWKICPLICYDLRFPVWSRNVNAEYDLLIYLANWPASRAGVWQTLLKARAIENQSYVIGVNRIGRDVANVYQGDSQLINAKGEEELNAQEGEGLFNVELNRHALIEFRKKFPVLCDGDDFELSC